MTISVIYIKTERDNEMEIKSAKDSFIMRHNWIENMRELPKFEGFKMLAWEKYQEKLQDDKIKENTSNFINAARLSAFFCKNRKIKGDILSQKTKNGEIGRDPKRDKIGFM